MKYFIINDEKKRFVFSVKAISEYLDSLNTDDSSDNSMEEVLKWAYSGFKFGAKADKVTFDLSKDKIEDALDADFDLFCEIASYCRKQFQVFQKAVAGDYNPDDKDEAKKKAKE